MPGPCAPASAATQMPTWPPWNSKRASQLCRPRKKSPPQIRVIKISVRARQNRSLLPEGSRRVRLRTMENGSGMDEDVSTVRHTLVLRRVEPERNVARFYALMIEHDLFGRVILVRHWGRIGSKGRERAEAHADEGEATQAMGKLAAAKRQRGYQDL